MVVVVVVVVVWRWFGVCVVRVAEGDALKQAIKLQIEYYLSRENLARDTFLLNQMNAQAYAPIELIAGFSKMKSLPRTAP